MRASIVAIVGEQISRLQRDHVGPEDRAVMTGAFIAASDVDAGKTGDPSLLLLNDIARRWSGHQNVTPSTPVVGDEVLDERQDVRERVRRRRRSARRS